MGKYDSYNKEDLITLLEKQDRELKLKKYGLVWDAEKEPEQVVLDCKNNLPILKNIKEKDIAINDDDYNIMIEGDNYHALQVLNYTHKNKIDVIYIDPPYNTGNKDFKYNDKFVEKEDGYRHSKWLNFMEKRLSLAKELLKKTGVMFISIDDNEQANLKLLCDKIFGEENFVTNIGLEITKTQGMKVKSAQEGTVVKNYEYILCYSKNIFLGSKVKNILYDKGEIFDTHYNSYIIQEGNEYIRYNLTDFLLRNETINKILNKYGFLNNDKLSIKSIEKAIIVSNEFKKIIFEDLSDNIYQETACNIFIPLDILKTITNESIIKYNDYLITKATGGKIRQYISLKKSLNYDEGYYPSYGRVTIRGNLWKGFYSDMMNVAKEGDIDFKNGKKPVRLIKQLIKWYTEKNEIILDFFAGSGTTAHAVLALNKEDGGERKFIVCTNNEGNIAEEVCYPRIQKVINGYTKAKNNEAVAGLGGNLKYFKTGFVKNTNNELKLKLGITKECTQMLCLKNNAFNLESEHDNYKIFSNNKKNKFIAIYYNFYDDDFDEFIDKVKLIKNKTVVYIFSLDNVVDKHLFEEYKHISIEAIPEQILEVYKQIQKEHIK